MIFAVGLTTAAVAVVANVLMPSLPWAAAIALGAIITPPDAVAENDLDWMEVSDPLLAANADATH